MAAIAKGAKRPASNLRGALLSLQPLEVIYIGRGEVKTLTQAQWVPWSAMADRSSPDVRHVPSMSSLSNCYRARTRIRSCSSPMPQPC